MDAQTILSARDAAKNSRESLFQAVEWDGARKKYGDDYDTILAKANRRQRQYAKFQNEVLRRMRSTGAG